MERVYGFGEEEIGGGQIHDLGYGKPQPEERERERERVIVTEGVKELLGVESLKRRFNPFLPTTEELMHILFANSPQLPLLHPATHHSITDNITNYSSFKHFKLFVLLSLTSIQCSEPRRTGEVQWFKWPDTSERILDLTGGIWLFLSLSFFIHCFLPWCWSVDRYE